MVTNEILKEFKDRMHISHSSEDDNLKQLLSFSISAIKGSCGDFDVNGKSEFDIRAKELVFERTRYVYNDALEFFDNNFLTQINNLGISIVLQDEVDTDDQI